MVMSVRNTISILASINNGYQYRLFCFVFLAFLLPYNLSCFFLQGLTILATDRQRASFCLLSILNTLMVELLEGMTVNNSD